MKLLFKWMRRRTTCLQSPECGTVWTGRRSEEVIVRRPHRRSRTSGLRIFPGRVEISMRGWDTRTQMVRLWLTRRKRDFFQIIVLRDAASLSHFTWKLFIIVVGRNYDWCFVYLVCVCWIAWRDLASSYTKRKKIASSVLKFTFIY